MQPKNADKIKDFLISAETYIRSLALPDGQLVISSTRKTGFLGFLFCIRSLQYLYETLIATPVPTLKFLMTYKLSQDHIELLFGLIRSMGGWNNNPTVRQFYAAYKKLLVHNDLQDVVRGNCLPLESVQILNVSSRCLRNTEYNYSSIQLINNSVLKRRILDDAGKQEADDYIYIPSHSHLSKCVNKIVAYIGGFVAQKLTRCLRCEPCISALSLDKDDANSLHSLVAIKDRGNLVYPSDGVIDICITAEKLFR